MRSPSPLTPIFDPMKRVGALAVGNSPGDPWAIGTQYVFNYTGALQQFTVPAGKTFMRIRAIAGSGSPSSGTACGKGGLIIGEFATVGGAVYDVWVGQGPTGQIAGFPNGGTGGKANNDGAAGGGSSSVTLTAASFDAGFAASLIVAGAGGGRSDIGFNVGNGGAGGYLVGGSSTSPYVPSLGGTQSAGGFGSYENGDIDGLGYGGDGEVLGIVAKAEGGGGGGGWHGGGGSATQGAIGGGEGGAGGGGSSYVAPSGTIIDFTNAFRLGNGQIIFSVV